MSAGALSSSTMLGGVRRIVRADLSSLTTQIDLDGFYPEEVLQKRLVPEGFANISPRRTRPACATW